MRLLLIIAAYWIVVVYPWLWNTYITIIQNDLQEATHAQTMCNAINGNHPSECPLTTEVNTGSWILINLDLGCQCMVVSVCLCSSEILKFWWEVHRIMYNKPFLQGLYEVRDLVTGKREIRDLSKRSTSSFQSNVSVASSKDTN